MKKAVSCILAFAIVLVFVLALAGCGEKEAGDRPSEASSVTSSGTGEAVAPGMFKKGLWEAVKDGERTGYYYFSENGSECKYKDAGLLSGFPFDYEIKGEGYVFHMAAVDDNTPVSLKEEYAEDAESYTLIFADREEQIRYIRDCTIEEYTEKQ